MTEFTDSLKTMSIADMLELCMTCSAAAVNARLDPKMVWECREKIQAMRREILTRCGAWEKAAIARPMSEQEAEALVRELEAESVRYALNKGREAREALDECRELRARIIAAMAGLPPLDPKGPGEPKGKA